MVAFNELWASKEPVLLPCPCCGKSEMTFNLKPAYKPKQEDKSKYLPSETNVFEKQHKYCLGRNELGIDILKCPITVILLGMGIDLFFE